LSDGNLPEHFFSKPITHYNNMSNRAKKIFEDLHDAEVESDKGIK
jgi:O-antigen chain-terminating methyltransferase